MGWGNGVGRGEGEPHRVPMEVGEVGYRYHGTYVVGSHTHCGRALAYRGGGGGETKGKW